jgi:hypothetical protein
VWEKGKGKGLGQWGISPDDWGNVYYNSNSNELFQNTDIKGGVVAILYDRNKVFGAIQKFIPNDDLRKIAILNEEIIRKIEPYFSLSP